MGTGNGPPYDSGSATTDIGTHPKNFSVSFNGRTAFRYNQGTGVLAVDMDERDLAVYRQRFGEIPENGISIPITLPTEPRPVYLDGVRSVERLLQEGEPSVTLSGEDILIRLHPIIQEPRQRQSFSDRLKKYFRI